MAKDWSMSEIVQSGKWAMRKRVSAQAHPLHVRLTLFATKKDSIQFPGSSLFKFVLLSLVQVPFSRGVCLSMAERSDATCIKTSTRLSAKLKYLVIFIGLYSTVCYTNLDNGVLMKPLLFMIDIGRRV